MISEQQLFEIGFSKSTREGRIVYEIRDIFYPNLIVYDREKKILFIEYDRILKKRRRNGERRIKSILVPIIWNIKGKKMLIKCLKILTKR